MPLLNPITFEAHDPARLNVRDWVCVALVAFPWFWPLLFGPLPAMGPDLAAWVCAALLLGCLPMDESRVTWIVVRGLLLAAVGNSLLCMLQYFDLEDDFFPWIVSTLPGRVLANVHQVNMLATLLAIGLLCIWHLWREGLMKRPAVELWAAIILAALAATASRTGLLHLVGIFVLLCIWHPGHLRRVALVAAVAVLFYAFMSLLLPWLLWVARGIGADRDILSRFGEAALCHSRLVLWGNMLELISLKPWSGWGSGGLLYAHYITPYEGQRFCEKLSNAHNLPLHMMVVFGIPLAILMMLLVLAFLFRLKPWAETRPAAQLGWSTLGLIGLHSMLEYPLWFGGFQLLGGLAVMLVFMGRRAQQTPQHVHSRAVMMSGGMRTFAAAIAVSLLGFLSWDYLKVSQLYLPEALRLERYKTDTFEKARGTLLFQEHVLIAQVVQSDITSQNAEPMLHGALQSLRIAPDPRIIEKVIKVAAFLGRTDLVQLHAERYRASWPAQFDKWQKGIGVGSDEVGVSSAP